MQLQIIGCIKTAVSLKSYYFLIGPNRIKQTTWKWSKIVKYRIVCTVGLIVIYYEYFININVVALLRLYCAM